MARKKKSTANPFIIKFILVTLLTGAVGFGLATGAVYLLRTSRYFRIQSVVIDPALQFINKGDLKNLIGKNIFEVDLKRVQHRLSYKYPQASDLKVVKHFPGRIAIVAKERLPFAEVRVGSRAVVLDEEGVILSVNEKSDGTLPVILGARDSRQKMSPGFPFDGADTRIALKIADYFQANKDLSAYSIHFINIENLSKIYVTLSNGLQVILDRERIAQRIKVLGVVLAQGNLQMDHVKYVDLRFKEPIIGKK